MLAHPGKPVTSGPRTFAGLQAYPRTLVELDRVRGAAAAPALRRAGGRLIEPSLALWRLPSWTAQRLLPGLQRRGLVRSVTPDVPIGTDPRGASGFFGGSSPTRSRRTSGGRRTSASATGSRRARESR